MRSHFLNTIFNKFSLLLIITFSGICSAGEEINQSLSVEATGTVFVKIPRGIVKIQGWDKQEVMIQGELDDTAKQLIFETKKNKTLIKIDIEGQDHWGDSSELSIFMPQQSKLSFKGIDTAFTISNLNNHMEGKSISGNLNIKNSHGKIKLSVVSGDVTLLESSGFTKIESVSGMIDFSGDFKESSLKTMSGDITANISGTDKLSIKNISGDTQINGQVKNKAQVKLSSVNGDISYQVTDELNAECELVSQFGGEINNLLTDDLPNDGSLHKQTLNFVSGDGSGKLSINTVNGSILIEKTSNE